MRPLLATARFLTRLPIPGRGDADTLQDIRAAWFPAVGLLLGAILAAADHGLAGLSWPVRNALLVGLGAGLSGGLHLDALMDTADGLSAPDATGAAMMRASVHAPAAVIAGTVALSLTWLALMQIEGATRPWWLLLTPAVARGAIVLGYAAFQPGAQAGPVTRSLGTSAHSGAARGALLVLAGLVIWLLGREGLLAIALGATSALAATAALARIGGGLSGDHFGSLAVIAECAMLLSAMGSTPAL